MSDEGFSVVMGRKAAVLAGSVVVTLGISACGGDAEAEGSSDEQQIVALVDDWSRALADGDFEAACDLQTDAFQEELVAVAEEVLAVAADLESDAGLGETTCATGAEVATVSSEPLEPAEVQDVEVDGDRATGTVDSNTWRFERVDGEWLLAYAD